MDYPGGFITKTAPTLNPALGNAAPGVWRLNDVLKNIKAGTWPGYDPYFDYTTLLLHGNGTNGGQNNTFLDSSTNNFTITRNGNTTQGTFSPFSQTGWSNYFGSGGASYLIANATDTSKFAFGTGDFTIEFWIYADALTAPSGFVTFYDQRAASTDGVCPTIYYYSDQLLVLVQTTNVIYGSSLSLNQWTHIALSRVSGNSRLFVNGVQTGSTYSDSNNYVAPSSDIRIFANAYGGSRSPAGYCSNFRVVKGTGLYSANFTPPVAALTAISGTSLLTCQGNRFVDASSNGFAVTPYNSVSVQAFSPFAPTAAYSASTVGGSGYFDGTGDYLTFPDSASFDYSTGDFTCDMWVYPTTVSGDKVLLQLGSYGSGQTGIVFLLSNGGKVFYGYNGGFGGESSGSVLINTWSYLSFVRSSGTLKMYVNGVEKYSTSFTSSIAPSTDFSIGSNLNPLGSQFSGYLTSVRLSNTARSSSVPTTPITNDGNTQLLLNFTNAAIIDNTAKNVLETVADAQISTTQSKFGGASMYFDGTGDYLLAPSTPNFAFNAGEFTVEMWLYPTASFGSGGVNIVGVNSSGGGLFVGGTNKIAWNLFGTGDLVAFSNFTSSYNNVWTHVAYTRSGSTGRLFINGVLQATGTDSTNYTVTSNFAIGAAYNGNQPYTGYIDDLRITKGIARYTANFTPQTSQWQDQ